MPRAPFRPLTAALAVILAVAPAACSTSTAAPAPATSAAAPAPSTSALSAPSTSAATPAPATSAPVGTESPNAPPASGTGLSGRTVVLNCPVDRADPPCPSTPVRARVVVLNQTGRTTLATVETDADGLFTVPLPAGSYMIRAAGVGGSTARRPATRLVTVSAGRITTVTIRLITGLR